MINFYVVEIYIVSCFTCATCTRKPYARKIFYPYSEFLEAYASLLQGEESLNA